MELFHKGEAIEMDFNATNSKGFRWEIKELDELDRYYLPLIKKPIKKLIIGISFS
ncbi:MAG: hypothetical protein ACXAC8_16000 [Candidatus Hodarchaeales archaeon]